MTGALIGLAIKNWKALAIVGACIAVWLLWQWDRSAQYDAGREAERIAARERAMELIEKRRADDAEISDLDAQELCVELGGNWNAARLTCN